MGMDINGLNPKLKGVTPEFPDNYERLSDEEQRSYWDERDHFLRENPGVYFRSNLWGWRPIAQLCMIAIENSGLNFEDVNWQYNDGDGLKTQEDCDLLANALEYIIKEEDNLQEDQDLIYLVSGIWDRINGGRVNEKITEELNAIYHTGSILYTSIVGNDGEVYQPSHSTSLSRIKSFIAFLRGCGGFEIW